MNAKQFVKNPNYFKELQTDLSETLVNMMTSEDAVWRKTWRPNPNENIFPINVETKRQFNGINIFLLWGKSASNLWGTFDCYFVGIKRCFVGGAYSIRMI